MLQDVTNAPEVPLRATHLLIMLYLSVMFRLTFDLIVTLTLGVGT